MLSSNLLSLLVCLVFASSVAAHLDWVNALPKCWQKCLKATSDGCAAKSCEFLQRIPLVPLVPLVHVARTDGSMQASAKPAKASRTSPAQYRV
jgi:hypothetical protein